MCKLLSLATQCLRESGSAPAAACRAARLGLLHTAVRSGPEAGVCAGAGSAKCQWLFSKCLTASDTNKLSRMILPRQAVETFLPFVEDRAGP